MPDDSSIFVMNKNKKNGESLSKLKPLEKKPFKNKFIDDLTLETADLKIIGTQKQVPRGERLAGKVSVVCDICGIEEEIPEALARKETYKCNACCTNKGRQAAKKLQEQNQDE